MTKEKLARKCTKGKMKKSQKDINLVFRDTGSYVKVGQTSTGKP